MNSSKHILVGASFAMLVCSYMGISLYGLETGKQVYVALVLVTLSWCIHILGGGNILPWLR
jgi:hypothetical protein